MGNAKNDNQKIPGNVGIGDSTPYGKSDVNGNLTTNSSLVANTPTVSISDNQNNKAGIVMGNISTGSSADFRFSIEDPNTAGSYVSFTARG